MMYEDLWLSIVNISVNKYWIPAAIHQITGNHGAVAAALKRKKEENADKKLVLSNLIEPFFSSK